MRGFAELPARIEALAREHERLAVVLLDAFGWAFVQRHADHPFLRRLEIEQVASQFPSTTTAHLTTLYTGLPVEEHGLYEWRVYEPSIDAVIRPLPFLPGARRRPAADDRPARRAAAGAVLRARAGDRPAAGGDHGQQVRLGGARGRARERLRDDRGGRGAAGRRAGPDVPVLGPDRRHRPPARAVERRCSTPRSCARSTRWRRSTRRCSSPPTTARSTSTSPTSSTSSGRRCSTT